MTKTSILLTVATKWEEGPISRRLGAAAEIVKTGMGAQNAARALAAVENPARYGLVISTGFAGALQSAMRTGDIVADLQGLDLSLVEAARDTAAKLGLRIHFGKIIHSDAVVADKAALGRKFRASAVDMETNSVRQWAAEHGVPSCAVRAVLDEVEDRLPPPPQGENLTSLVSYAISNWRQLPLLASTGLKQRRASSTLVRFLKGFLDSRMALCQ